MRPPRPSPPCTMSLCTHRPVSRYLPAHCRRLISQICISNRLTRARRDATLRNPTKQVCVGIAVDRPVVVLVDCPCDATPSPHLIFFFFKFSYGGGFREPVSVIIWKRRDAAPAASNWLSLSAEMGYWDRGPRPTPASVSSYRGGRVTDRVLVPPAGLTPSPDAPSEPLC